MTVVIAHAAHSGHADPAGSDPVVETGLAYARSLGVGAHVLNVTTGSAPLETRTATPDDLEALRTRVAGDDVAVTVEQVADPDPAGTILRRAEELGATLVVVGVRRRSPVGKLFLGSVSQTVILEASVPVLAVK